MMKTIATLLVIAAFLAGSFISVLDPRAVDWSWLVPALLIGAIGLWLSRKAHHQAARAGNKLAGNIGLLGKCLENILARLELLCKNKEELPTYEARFEIDRLFRARPVPPGHRHGRSSSGAGPEALLRRLLMRLIIALPITRNPGVQP